jgi:hypothetical protein
MSTRLHSLCLVIVLTFATHWAMSVWAMQLSLPKEERKYLEEQLAEETFEEELQAVLKKWAMNGQKGLPETPHPATYSAKAIEAWVVDEETGQPLEGVLVVAHWQLAPLLGHGPPVGQVTVLETVTDTKGRLYFPAWGPKPREPKSGLLTYYDPEIFLFKSGYRWRSLRNDVQTLMKNSVRSSDWSGQTLKLKKVAGNDEQYAKSVEALEENLEFAFRHDDCSWKQIPRILAVLHVESQRLIEKKINNVRSAMESWENHNKSTVEKCGSVQTFLRSYLP